MTARDDFKFPENFTDDGLPRGTLSPSQYSMYLRCSRQYEYRYIEERKEAPGIALARGSAIHKGAEVTHQRTIDTGKPASMEEASQAVADTFTERSVEVEDWTDNKGNVLIKGDIKDKTISSFQVYYAQAVPLINPVKVEKPFAVKVGTVPVFGIIDLIDSIIDTEMSLENDPDNPSHIEVVSDLKTTGKRWAPQKLRCDPQLTFYAIAENTTKVRWDFVIDQKSGTVYEPKRSERNDNDKRILIEDVEMVAHLIKKGVSFRCDSTSWACTPRYCGFFERCRGPR
jgi:hypothetical protein